MKDVFQNSQSKSKLKLMELVTWSSGLSRHLRNQRLCEQTSQWLGTCALGKGTSPHFPVLGCGRNALLQQRNSEV